MADRLTFKRTAFHQLKAVGMKTDLTSSQQKNALRFVNKYCVGCKLVCNGATSVTEKGEVVCGDETPNLACPAEGKTITV